MSMSCVIVLLTGTTDCSAIESPPSSYYNSESDLISETEDFDEDSKDLEGKAQTSLLARSSKITRYLISFFAPKTPGFEDEMSLKRIITFLMNIFELRTLI